MCSWNWAWEAPPGAFLSSQGAQGPVWPAASGLRLSLRFLVVPSSGGPSLSAWCSHTLPSPPRDVSVSSPTPLLQALPPIPGATVPSARYHLQNQGHSDPTLVIINTWLSLCARTVLGTLHILHHLIFATFNHLILTFNHLILTRSFLVAQPEEPASMQELQ